MTIKSFATGFCTAGNHDYCRGAIRRPGQDEPWRCTCKCHKGKEIELPPEAPARILNPRLALQAEAEEWASQMVVHGYIQIPCEYGPHASIAARIRKAAKDINEPKILTRWTDGVLTARLPDVKKPRKKRATKQKGK